MKKAENSNTQVNYDGRTESQNATVLNQSEIDHRWVYRAVKRTFDTICSALALVILSPLFLIVAILIKLEDRGGPVFYSQTRIGRNGKKFKMYKFRSMVTDADQRLKELLKQSDVEGAMFKMKNDPRVTKIGKFIRKYSIDELPQLLNVVKGDMTLVGPRPPLQREVDLYTEYDRQRLMVTPGCTGLWQVSARNSVGFHGMVDIDINYIRRSGVLFDFSIIARTVLIMFKPNSAY